MHVLLQNQLQEGKKYFKLSTLFGVVDSVILEEKGVPDAESVPMTLFSLDINADDEHIKYYTGLPSYAAFHNLCDILTPVFLAEKKNACSLMTPNRQLLMVLMKLRHAFKHQDLAYRFDVSVSQVSRVFHYWIDLLSRELQCLIHWPDREVIRQTLPKCFKPGFSRSV